MCTCTSPVCYDRMTAGQQAAHTSLYRHAYAWADKLVQVERATRDQAEAYAAWFAARSWDDESAQVAHTDGWATWQAEQVAA